MFDNNSLIDKNIFVIDNNKINIFYNFFYNISNNVCNNICNNICNNVCNNIFYSLKIGSIFSGIFIVAGSIAFYFVGTFIYLPIRKSFNKNVKDFQLDDNSAFELKYLDEFESLECNDLSDNYIESYVEELSPLGLIVMKYDKKNNFFNYYCDRKDIPFKFLDTVSRKFMIDYNCKSIDCSIKKEKEEEEEKAKEKEEKDKEEQEKAKEEQEKAKEKESKKVSFDDSVFIKPKNMRNKNSVSENSVSENTTTKAATTKDTTPEILINNYKYKGKLNDYYELNKKIEINLEKKNREVLDEKISYSNFKNKID